MTQAAALKAVRSDIATAMSSERGVQRRPLNLSDAVRGPALPSFGSSLASLPAQPRVQRKCAECEAEEKEEKTARRKPSAATVLDEDQEEEGTSVQPSLEVGPAGDRYEREADTIAAQTLAMPAPAPITAQDAPGGVQRKCAACEAEEKVQPRRLGIAASSAASLMPRRKCAHCEAEEVAVRPRRATGDATRIAASADRLSSGGRPMPSSTRDFFETRMGRDLGHVRVHDGGESRQLNGSIAARAFTYGSHVWLGHGERADTGFTMAHELAHVLQQTQPGTVRSRPAAMAASEAGPTVQRLGELRTFWLPEGLKKSALSQHSVIHDKAADAMAKANPSKNLIREAPIPGAKAKVAAVGEKGFADLYESDKATIGLQETKAAQAPGSNANPVRHFNPRQRKKATRGASLAPYLHTSERAPKLNAKGDVVELGNAPTRIRIADMKPGHNISARADGVTQIGNYVAGINGVVKATNTKLPGGSGWNCDAQAMEVDGLGAPATWEPDVAGVKKSGMKLRLHKNGKPVFQTDKKGKKKDVSTGILGSWVIAEDKTNRGIWTYLLAPQQASLDAALQDPDTTKKFADVQRRLKERVIDKLTKKPQARRRRESVPTVARPSARAIRRAPLKGGAKPAKDTFNFNEWNKGRLGQSEKDLSGFRGYYKDKIDAGDRSAVEFQKDVLDSIKLMEANFSGVSRHVGSEQRIKEQAATLRRFEFWISPAGAVLGHLRRVFGALFIKVAELGGNIKEKVKTALEKFSFKGSKSASGLKAVAMRVGAKVLKIVGGIILQRTIKALTDCVAKGVTKTMHNLVEGTPIEELEAKIKEIEDFVNTAETKVVEQVTAMADDILGPMKEELEKLSNDASFVFELVGMAKKIMNAIRLGACIVGGVETFGVACAVALGDFFLSLFDASPVDALAGKLLETCDAQKMMADFLGASAFVRGLPVTIAQGVVEKLKPLLPSWAQDLLCDPSEMKVEPYRTSDFVCGGGGGGKGGEEGTGTPGGGGGQGTGNQGGKKGGGKKGGGKKGGATDGGGATKGGSTGQSGDTKKGQSGDQDIKTTTPKPVPPGFKKTHDKQHKFLPVSGFPAKDKFIQDMPGQVTLLFIDDNMNPIVEVSDIDVIFKSASDPDEHGILTYEFSFQNEFFVEELNSKFEPTKTGESFNKARSRPR